MRVCKYAATCVSLHTQIYDVYGHAKGCSPLCSAAAGSSSCCRWGRGLGAARERLCGGYTPSRESPVPRGLRSLLVLSPPALPRGAASSRSGSVCVRWGDPSEGEAPCSLGRGCGGWGGASERPRRELLGALQNRALSLLPLGSPQLPRSCLALCQRRDVFQPPAPQKGSGEAGRGSRALREGAERLDGVAGALSSALGLPEDSPSAPPGLPSAPLTARSVPRL